MKNIILLLALSLVAKFSFAKTVHPSIYDDLDFKMETDYHESERGVAAFDEKKQEQEKSTDSKEAKSKEDRELASDQEVFDRINENGIRYWKLENTNE